MSTAPPFDVVQTPASRARDPPAAPAPAVMAIEDHAAPAQSPTATVTPPAAPLSALPVDTATSPLNWPFAEPVLSANCPDVPMDADPEPTITDPDASPEPVVKDAAPLAP